jgi:hypothetical protein
MVFSLSFGLNFKYYLDDFGFKGLNRDFISLNSVNQLIVVMVTCGVLFEVRTEF